MKLSSIRKHKKKGNQQQLLPSMRKLIFVFNNKWVYQILDGIILIFGRSTVKLMFHLKKTASRCNEPASAFVQISRRCDVVSRFDLKMKKKQFVYLLLKCTWSSYKGSWPQQQTIANNLFCFVLKGEAQRLSSCMMSLVTTNIS